jgi:hypothetical protein
VSEDGQMACVALTLFVGVCIFAPVVLAVIVFLILLGIAVIGLGELLGWFSGDDEEPR